MVKLFRKSDALRNIGILFESKLTFDAHIHIIKNKTLKLLGLIY